MIDIKDFPEGTKLNILFTAPITDYYGNKIPSNYACANMFGYSNNFNIPNTSALETPLFINEIDFSEVEFLNYRNIIGYYPNLPDDLVLNLPKIKELKFSQFDDTNLKTITLNCGEDFEIIDGRPKGESYSNKTIFTLNSNSNNIKKITQLEFGYLNEFHINCNCENLTTTPYISIYSNSTYLTYHSGFPNVKYSKNDNYYYYYLPNLTRESYLSIFNNLYDFTGNNETPTSSQGKLKFNSNIANVCTQEDINIAINKGWTITY